LHPASRRASNPHAQGDRYRTVTYLDDVQAFLRTEPNVAQEKIADIARFAARLREAMSKLDESEGKQFKARLDDLRKYPPAEPGALMSEPLEAALRGR
jgi:hypothetical protein